MHDFEHSDKSLDVWNNTGAFFWAHLCILHGGLICIAFCLSVPPSVPLSVPLSVRLSVCPDHRGVFGTEPIVTDYTLKKFTAANGYGISVVTGRTHCQRQVAFFTTYRRTNSHFWHCITVKSSTLHQNVSLHSFKNACICLGHAYCFGDPPPFGLIFFTDPLPHFYFVVPRRNEVAEGGYCITLRPSVRPTVRLE